MAMNFRLFLAGSYEKQTFVKLTVLSGTILCPEVQEEEICAFKTVLNKKKIKKTNKHKLFFPHLSVTKLGQFNSP